MAEKTIPIEVTLSVEEADDIEQLFIGFEDTDGTEFILATAEPPATVELKGTRLQSGTNRD
ncbi:hypothetical protein [Halobellus marinus]|jgi:hypothetical protein|uniref:hypothetical protein n=1 Tax=Halobellus TaxID=1073986 RepID=UPI0028B1FB2F|nr:hypothetical protein [Halobellus sp. DFY28]